MPAFRIFGAPVVVLSEIGDIKIDAVSQVTVRHDSMVTQNPIEDGTNVTDHIVNLPAVIEIQGRFSDSPMDLFGLSLGFNPLAGLSSAIQSGLGFFPSQSVAAWQALEELRKTKKTFAVNIQQGVYEGMVFEELEAPRDNQDGRSMRFQAVMRQIVTANLLTGILTAGGVSPDVADSAPAEVAQGTLPSFASAL